MATKVLTPGTTIVRKITSGRTIVKKIVVGIPLTKNVSSGANVDNLVGINTDGKQTGDVLLYDSDAGGDYVTTSLVDLVRSYISAGGDLSYDSATGEFSIDVEQIYTAENFDSDFIIAIQTIDGSLVPNLDSSYNLGSPTKKWKDLYLSGNTIYLGGISLVDQAGSFAVKDSNGAAAPFSLEANNTNDLAEGGNNLYYTRTRFDSALADGLSTQQIRAYFDGGTGVTYDSSTGVFSIGQPVATTDDVTFNNVDVSGELVVQGNLTVQGTTTTINSTTVSINDKNIVLADSAVDAAAANGAGITINGADASLTYSAAEDKFVFDKGVIAPNYQGVYLGFDSDLARNSTVQSIRGYFNAAGDLSYNSATGEFSFDVEEVYTKANFDSDFNDALDEASINGLGLSYNSATNTISITNTGVTANTYGSATRIPVFSVNAQGQLTLATETNIASVESIDFDSASGNFNVMTTDGQSFNTVITLDPYTTSNLTEGDDLYYTRARFDSALGDTTSIQSIRSYLNAGGDMSYDANTGTFSINVEEIYTKANFDSDFNVSVDEAALNGDGLSYNSGTNTLSITATGVDSGTYGSTTQIPVFTVNDRGQIDSIGTVLVAGVSSTSYDSSNGQLTINTADGNSFVTTLHDSADHVSRARYAITSVDNGGDGSFTYNASTGVLTYTGPSAAEVRSHFSASGDLSYDSATGQFTFDVEAVYTKANFDSDFNVSLDEAALGGTGLTYNSGTNTLDITNTGVVAGEYGSATQIPIITVNAQGQVDSISEILVAGVTDFGFDSSNGQFTISTADGGSFTTVATLDPYTTTTLAEGGNLYYTTARADSDAKNSVSATDAGGDGSLVYNNGTGVFTYTGPSATETRAHFTGGTGVTITDGTVEIGQTVDSTSDVIFGKVTVDSANVGGINFNATPGTYSSVPGALYWDSDPQKGLSFTPTTNEGNSDVTINIGQESLIYVHNQTGETVSNGDIVYISGTAHGQHPSITKAKADVAVSGTVAMATMDMVDNAHGYVTRFGLVRDLNTGGLTAGADVYLSVDSAGKWTTNSVTVDDGYPIHIGKIIRVDSSTGSILIDPFTEHFEYLRIQDRMIVTGSVEASTMLIDSSLKFADIDYALRPAWDEGRMWYDQDGKTLAYHTADSDYVQYIGEREWVRGRNSSGLFIAKGTPVYTDGVHIAGHPIHGHHPLIYSADAAVDGKYEVIGVTAHDVPNGAHGYVITRGWIQDIDTTGLVSGQRFHLAPGGGYQVAAANYPNYPIDLGIALTIDSAGAGGSVYIDVNSHTQEQLRITGDGRVDGNFTVGGNLNVVGVTTSAITQDITVSSNLVKLLDGNTLGTAYQSVGGLDDATFIGSYRGDSDLFYFVRIASTDSSGDVIEWGISDSDLMSYGSFNGTYGYGAGFDSANGPTTWNLITNGLTAPLRNNISIRFINETGHQDSDVWCAHPTELNLDLGMVGNYNPAGPGGIKYAGLYRSATDARWRFFDGLTQNLDSSVVSISDSDGFTLSDVQANTFYGSLSGNATSATSATQLATGRAFSLTGDITATGVSFDGTGSVQLTTVYNPGSIVNADINATAGIVDTKLATISTAGKVSNSATTATALNTGSAIVARDVSGNFTAGTITAALTGNVTGQVSDISNHSTTDLSEGDNLYYTKVRVDSDVNQGFTDRNTTNLVEGDNLYYTKARVDSDVNQGFTDRTTTDVAEGTNLYYTTVRADSDFDVRLTTKSTTDVAEGTNLYYTTARADSDFDARLTTKSTDDVTEGTNLYYTTARADSDAKNAISVTDTGGDGSLSYNPITGIITYTGPSPSEIRSHFSAGGDLSYDSATGRFSIDVETIYTKINFDSDLGDASTDDLPEGIINLYYTTARADSDFDSRLTTKTTTNVAEGTNLYYTTARADSDFDARLNIKSTTDVAEGSNLYYTTARADSDVTALVDSDYIAARIIEADPAGTAVAMAIALG